MSTWTDYVTETADHYVRNWKDVARNTLSNAGYKPRMRQPRSLIFYSMIPTKLGEIDTQVELAKMVRASALEMVQHKNRKPSTTDEQNNNKRVRALFNVLYHAYKENPEAYCNQYPGMEAVPLQPMTQIIKKGAFGVQSIEHHGVYLGYGVVLEVAAEECHTTIRPLPVTAASIPQQLLAGKTCLGLTRLSHFGRGHTGAETGELVFEAVLASPNKTKEERDSQIAQGFEEAKTLVDTKDGLIKYNILTNNCQTTSNQITRGVNQLSQFNYIRRGLAGAGLCEDPGDPPQTGKITLSLDTKSPV